MQLQYNVLQVSTRNHAFSCHAFAPFQEKAEDILLPWHPQAAKGWGGQVAKTYDLSQGQQVTIILAMVTRSYNNIYIYLDIKKYVYIYIHKNIYYNHHSNRKSQLEERLPILQLYYCHDSHHSVQSLTPFTNLLSCLETMAQNHQKTGNNNTQPDPAKYNRELATKYGTRKQ